MKYKCIIITIVGILLSSCSQKHNDHLYSAVMSDYYLAIPITNQKDSCIYMDQAYNFCVNTNMYILDLETILTLLFNHVKTNTYIQLTDSYYEKLYTLSVHEDPEINAVYQREGINGVLNRYTKVTNPGYAVFQTELSWEQRDYIMYLLFQEGIYTDFSDGDAYIILNSK